MLNQTNKILILFFAYKDLFLLAGTPFSWPQVTQGIDEMKRVSFIFVLLFPTFKQA